MNIFTLCGSLRTGSFNAAALRAAAELCPPPGRVLVEPGLDALPFFNADDEANALPGVVGAFRERLQAADAILISSPEYASGTSGVLKNALEWLVGGEGMADKPVALMSASSAMTGGARAQAWLAETLATMGARVLPDGLQIPGASRKIVDGRLEDEPTRRALAELLGRLVAAGAEYQRGRAQWSDGPLTVGI